MRVWESWCIRVQGAVDAAARVDALRPLVAAEGETEGHGKHRSGRRAVPREPVGQSTVAAEQRFLRQCRHV